MPFCFEINFLAFSYYLVNSAKELIRTLKLPIVLHEIVIKAWRIVHNVLNQTTKIQFSEKKVRQREPANPNFKLQQL